MYLAALVITLMGALGLWLAISPRGMWWTAISWRYRDPKAVEPSDAIYAILRASGFAYIGFAILLGVLFGNKVIADFRANQLEQSMSAKAAEVHEFFGPDFPSIVGIIPQWAVTQVGPSQADRPPLGWVGVNTDTREPLALFQLGATGVGMPSNEYGLSGGPPPGADLVIRAPYAWDRLMCNGIVEYGVEETPTAITVGFGSLVSSAGSSGGPLTCLGDSNRAAFVAIDLAAPVGTRQVLDQAGVPVPVLGQ